MAIADNERAADESAGLAVVGSSSLPAAEASQSSPTASLKRKRSHGGLVKNLTRAVSPPWRLPSAEGPSSYTQNGIRKSARTNELPLDMRPGADTRRHTRAERRHEVGSGYPSNRTNGMPPRKKALHLVDNARSRDGSSGKKNSPKQVQGQEDGRIRHKRKHSAHTKDLPAFPTAKKSPKKHDLSLQDSPRVKRFKKDRQLSPTEPGHRKVRVSRPETDDAARPSGIKIKLRGLLFGRPPAPRVLPDQPPKQPYGGSLSAWLNDYDPFEGEADSERPMNDADAKSLAYSIDRLVQAAEPGGLLSQDRCSYTNWAPAESPRRVFGHWNHVVNHALYFRDLMLREQREHQALSKKLAGAATYAIQFDSKGRFAKLRPRISKEEWVATQIGYQLKRARQVIKDLAARWDLVRREVDKQRRIEHEAQKQREGKKALDELLDQKMAVLDHRRRVGQTQSDSGSDMESSDSDADGDDGSSSQYKRRDFNHANIDEVETDSDEDVSAGSELDLNMSSEDEESADDGSRMSVDDEAELTQDQLRNKYAQILIEQAQVQSDSDDAHDTSLDIESVSEHTDMAAIKLEEVDAMLEEDEDEDSGSATESDSDDSEEASASSEDETDNPLLDFYGTGAFRDLKPAVGASDGGHVAEFERPNIAKHDIASRSGTPSRVSEQALDQARSPSGTTDALANEDTSTPALVSGKNTPLSNVITADTSRETSLEKARSETTIEIGQLLRGSLRQYQTAGLEWLAGLYSNGDNGILADEMGLGKTIQTISLLCHLALQHEKWGPHLIVVPTSVMLNWEMEFKKFAPGFKVLTYYGSPEERKKKRHGWLRDDMWNVVITSYQLIVQDAQAFRRRTWHYLILDEAHQIKNYQTQKWQIMLNMRTEARLLLTGTPLQNNLSELWSLLYFIMPGGLDGQGGFADLEKYTNMMKRPADMILNQGRQKLDAESQAQVDKFHEILRPHLLRRLKADVEKQMPGKYEHLVFCRMSKRQRELYDTFMRRSDTQQALHSGNYMSIMTSLMSLRKVCNHPDLFEERQIVTSFNMPRSAVADFEIKDLFIRRRLLRDRDDSVSVDAIGINLLRNEQSSLYHTQRRRELQAVRELGSIRQSLMAGFSGNELPQDGLSLRSAWNTVQRGLAESRNQQMRNYELQTQAQASQLPIWGSELSTIASIGLRCVPNQSHSKQYTQVYDSKEHAAIFPTIRSSDFSLADLQTSVADRARLMELRITKFSCTTPAVVAADILPYTLAVSDKSVDDLRALTLQYLTDAGAELTNGTALTATSKTAPPLPMITTLVDVADPFHEARVRQTIAFPDSRLLQYDCGKLQRLAGLLRELQAGGHRALIFTQMTLVLDILERFLNIHGHRYLRLDGSTKIEQRQLLTERFNSDDSILCFILSSRSGGIGINLTGADTVIFYDMDWNPAMDKQCQDRCHRIGQTRDVHIYRLVSEHTIEANVLLKANQKRLLDEVIIQKGEFTTDTFNQRMTYKDAIEDAPEDAADAVMARILGDGRALGGMLRGVEDEADANAAAAAQQEVQDIEAEDKKEQLALNDEQGQKTDWSGPSDPDGERPHVDEYMLAFMTREMAEIPLTLVSAARDKKVAKKAQDKHRRR